MRRPLNPLLRWLLGVILSLPIALAVWWQWLREPLIRGLAQALDLATPWLWPDTLLSMILYRGQHLIISLLPPLNDSAQLFVALPLSFNRAVVILPLFWGLTLATPGRALLRRLLIGTLLLLPIALVMMLLYAQFQIALYRTHLPTLTELPPTDYALALPNSPTVYYLWGLGRQMAVLVLPIVAPLLVWLLLHRAFLRKVIAGGLLQRLTRPTPPASFDPE